MIPWIVVWFTMEMTGCPQPPPDPYERQANTISAGLCTQRVKHEKYFETLTEADKFVADAPKDGTVMDIMLITEQPPQGSQGTP